MNYMYITYYVVIPLMFQRFYEKQWPWVFLVFLLSHLGLFIFIEWLNAMDTYSYWQLLELDVPLCCYQFYALIMNCECSINVSSLKMLRPSCFPLSSLPLSFISCPSFMSLWWWKTFQIGLLIRYLWTDHVVSLLLILHLMLSNLQLYFCLSINMMWYVNIIPDSMLIIIFVYWVNNRINYTFTSFRYHIHVTCSLWIGDWW